MITAYKVIARAIAAFVTLQAAFIAAGVFGLVSAVEDHGLVFDAESAESDFTGSLGFMLHSIGGMVVVVLALILMGVSLGVRHGAPKWAGIVLGLAALQYLLGFYSHDYPWLGALHGINAFGVFAMALVAARKADEPAAATGLGTDAATRLNPSD